MSTSYKSFEQGQRVRYTAEGVVATLPPNPDAFGVVEEIEAPWSILVRWPNGSALESPEHIEVVP